MAFFFEEHVENPRYKASEYVNLYLKVKYFYTEYISTVEPFRSRSRNIQRK